MFKYVKAAFKSRWNLLAMIAGTGFALLSGNPDVWLPVVAAFEVGYLGFVSTHPKFQTHIDMREASAQKGQSTQNHEQVLRRIMRTLPREERDRFERLRVRCLQLRQIADDLKQNAVDDTSSLESSQMASLDRLLWIFLRLQFSRFSLQRFFGETNSQQIEQDIRRLEERLTATDANDHSEHSQKIRATLQDNLETSRARLANFQKAKANHEFVELELDRLENKIKSLAEVAVNRQEPDYISNQVDAVATSMLQTEETINDLDFITHLGSAQEEEPPQLMRPTLYIRE